MSNRQRRECSSELKQRRACSALTGRFSAETAIGALSLYISGGSVGDFQPMNVNFGIISPLGYRVKGKRNKNAEISARSLAIIEELMKKEVFGCENNS